MTQIFDVSILDEDGISKDDVASLYLMTSKAMASGDALQVFHNINSISDQRLFAVLMAPDVLTALCKKLEDGYKSNMGVAVDVDKEFLLTYINEIYKALSGVSD